jgi:hypothetical protein
VTNPLPSLERPNYSGQPAALTAAVEVAALRPRRSPARILVGLLLAAVLALTFVGLSLRADAKQPVLAVTTAVAAGQRLTSADLVVVRVAVEPAVAVVAASQLDQVLGHTAAVPLVRGTLLAPRQIGAAVWPPAGQAVIALLVKQGHAPTGLQPGAAVLVLITPTSGPAATGAGQGSTGAPLQAPATVVEVSRAVDITGSGTASVLVAQGDGVRLAGAAGDVSLVLLAPQS